MPTIIVPYTSVTRKKDCPKPSSYSASLRLLAGVAGVVEQDFLAQAGGVEVQVYFGG